MEINKEHLCGCWEEEGSSSTRRKDLCWSPKTSSKRDPSQEIKCASISKTNWSIILCGLILNEISRFSAVKIKTLFTCELRLESKEPGSDTIWCPVNTVGVSVCQTVLWLLQVRGGTSAERGRTHQGALILRLHIFKSIHNKCTKQLNGMLPTHTHTHTPSRLTITSSWLGH